MLPQIVESARLIAKVARSVFSCSFFLHNYLFIQISCNNTLVTPSILSPYTKGLILKYLPTVCSIPIFHTRKASKNATRYGGGVFVNGGIFAKIGGACMNQRIKDGGILPPGQQWIPIHTGSG
jgi:hypothetical protein